MTADQSDMREAWWTKPIDIGSKAGAEPCLRDMVEHYYTSHDVPLGAARNFTAKVIETLSREPVVPPADGPYLPASFNDVVAILKQARPMAWSLADGWTIDLLREVVRIARVVPAAGDAGRYLDYPCDGPFRDKATGKAQLVILCPTEAEVFAWAAMRMKRRG